MKILGQDSSKENEIHLLNAQKNLPSTRYFTNSTSKIIINKLLTLLNIKIDVLLTLVFVRLYIRKSYLCKKLSNAVRINKGLS